MPRKKPNESSLKNLVDRSAPDAPGQTEATTVRINVDDLQWLKSLPNGTSYHVRQAVKLYRESYEGDATEPSNDFELSDGNEAFQQASSDCSAGQSVE